jgi:ABC-type branched-subunit amino acid transport system ATPase component
MTEREPIILSDGEELEHVEDTYYTYLNKSIFIYGPSKTGKTVTVKHILKKLMPHIPIAFLICPSEPANNSYKGIIGRAALYLDVDIKFLKELFTFQEMRAQIFEKTNDIKVLEKLYLQVAHSRVDELLCILEDKYERAIEKARKFKNDAAAESEIKSIQEKYDDARKILYRKQISVNVSKFKEKKLSNEEVLVLEYINLNPNILLIFDDYAAGLKKMGNTEVMKNYMYRGRHAKITLMIVNHSSTDLPPSIRTNAFVIIFGSAEMATAYFAKSSGNGFTSEQAKEIKKKIDRVYEEKYREPEKYRKLVWVREGSAKQYYYFLADVVKTEMFGCDAFIEMCSRGEKDQNSLDTSNPYFAKFAF